MKFRAEAVIAIFAACIAVLCVSFLGHTLHQSPTRCSEGFLSLGPRCCAPGQGISEGKCVGEPSSCPEGFFLSKDLVVGCVRKNRRILIAGGSVTLGPTDWDSAELVQKTTVAVRPFFIDSLEVTMKRYQKCVSEGVCETHQELTEAGLPITKISFEEASTFCAFENGRLPTGAEWVFAATGKEARRFPWAPHGLVCRKASYGLVEGPCAQGGSFPDWSGSRDSGKTPEGLFDMAGNVAEWTQEAEGQRAIRGGSFRSQSASQLKVWASQMRAPGDDVVFRCAYSLPSSSE